MGLTPKEFYQYTWHEFSLRVEGYRRKQAEQWQHTREIAYITLAAGMNRPKNMPDKRKFMPLPTDQDGGDFDQAKREWEALKKANRGE